MEIRDKVLLPWIVKVKKLHYSVYEVRTSAGGSEYEKHILTTANFAEAVSKILEFKIAAKEETVTLVEFIKEYQSLKKLLSDLTSPIVEVTGSNAIKEITL